MPSNNSPRTGVIPSTRSTDLRSRLVQLAHFGLVGGLAFVVDLGIYNLLRATVLDDKPIGAKVISVAVATIVAWIGNRHLTFRKERGRPVLREGVLFAVMNVIGLAIAAACLFVSHYLLGFTSQLADNIAGNGIGLVLGTSFRFLAYRFLVFRPDRVVERPVDDVATPAYPRRRITFRPAMRTSRMFLRTSRILRSARSLDPVQ